FGWQVAKAIGGLDIGQCVCIKDQTVIAVEAIEGTDLCIRRAGELCKVTGMTIVKVAKPNQDMRFDVPTVGLKTLESIAHPGGGGESWPLKPAKRSFSTGLSSIKQHRN